MAYATISKPSLHFNTVTYSGTGSAQSITGVGFRPDWLWIKHREDVSNHKLQDVVRGSTKVIGSNENSAEATVPQGVTSFDSDGFSLGTDASVNGVGAKGIVAWCWKAGNAQGSSNTDGSLNTTYTSVNATAGISISKYTGNGSSTTLGHGLGVRPDMVITKRLDNTQDWVLQTIGSEDTSPYSVGFSSNDANLGFNLNRQVSGSESVGDNRASTLSSTTFRNIGTNNIVNANSGTYISFVIKSIKGFSKVGGYVGNGETALGPFIYTGFKPAFVMVKAWDTASREWVIIDNKRTGFNNKNHRLFPRITNAEDATDDIMDLYSNGFKCKSNNNATNQNGVSYWYWAIAEEPLVANVGQGIPATAR
jgi:hypothetical protein